MKNKKPAWQAGKYNGVGGKVEPNESWLEAMCREFEEETGVFIDQWEEFAIMESGDWICYCYRAFTYGIDKCKTMETEKVERLALDTALLCRPLMENLKWLIHLALDETPRFSKIVY